MDRVEPFYLERAKQGRASCKACKQKCENGDLRMAKMVLSPYKEGEYMKSWYHVDCLMNGFLKQRPTSKRINSITEIGNWSNLSAEDQATVLEKLNKMEREYAQKHKGKVDLNVLKNELKPATIETRESFFKSPKNNQMVQQEPDADQMKTSHDDKFYNFIKLCKKIAQRDSYTEKTALISVFFQRGTAKTEFTGDVTLWCKLLLPQAVKRVYNLKSKQLVKLFSHIFCTDQEDMLTHLEKGDVADTVETFFRKPASESTLTVQEVDSFLEYLSRLTREVDQIDHLKSIIKRCTADDLCMIIRLIKGDLRINAGPKHILEAVHPDAYMVFQTSRDIEIVMGRVLPQSNGVKNRGIIEAKMVVMTPVLPMLAEACKSIEMAMKKCPNGMFSEIKYDGERVQVHKRGKEFKYFSRALKTVMPHKVSHFKDYLPQAFPEGEDLVLDAEVLMVDIKTGKPLPFGTLGIHKKNEFSNAQVCLFVFDCLYYNGNDLMDMPIHKRRKILQENMVEVENHVMFSEQEIIRKSEDLVHMIAKVLKLGLEGLVLKDLDSTYEPGKRHWLKVKKDYLFDGAMADTADLVVLGAWFGTGRKGGMMSVFLMGCYDEIRDRWCTVTKVHGGHDDKTLEKLQDELRELMVKISRDSTKTPSWLNCSKGMIPDFIAKDPKKQPVWEITGTEFTKANIHTADGISIRFPRVTKIRIDKSWKTATNLEELKHLFKTSKEQTDVSLLNKLAESEKIKDHSPNTSTHLDSWNNETSDGEEPPKKKAKRSPVKTKTIDIYFGKSNASKKSSGKEVESEAKLPSEHLSMQVDSPEKKSTIQMLPENPLPDIFKDLKVAFYPDFISFSEKERIHFERHWVAFGGKVIKSMFARNADYIVHAEDSVELKLIKIMKNAKNPRHVTRSWIISCINERRILDTRPYSVKLL